MKITASLLRSLIREALQENDKYKSTFGGERQSFERGQGIVTGYDAARMIGRKKSPTGTKRASLGSPKIQRWISSGNRRRPALSGIWGKYDDRNGIVPFRNVDWTVGLLFSEGARYVGSQEGIDRSAGTEYIVADPTGLKSSPYSGYVYYITPNDFIQIDNVSVAQRADVFNKFRNATADQKEYYIRVFKGEEAPAKEIRKPAAVSAEPAAMSSEPAVAPTAPAQSTAEKTAAAKRKIKSQVRQPKDYAFWAGMIGRAAKGKAGSDSTFIKQVLGKNYEAEWTPPELQDFAHELMAMSR